MQWKSTKKRELINNKPRNKSIKFCGSYSLKLKEDL